MKKGHKKLFSFSTRLPGANQKNRKIEQDCENRHGIRPARLPTTLTQSGGVRGAFTGQFPRSLVSVAPCCKIKIKSLTFLFFYWNARHHVPAPPGAGHTPWKHTNFGRVECFDAMWVMWDRIIWSYWYIGARHAVGQVPSVGSSGARFKK